MIEKVFEKQRELMEVYEQIEHANGFNVPSTIPLDINDKFDQLRIKEMAWRTVEELAEVLEALKNGSLKELQEELADVLHFLSELTILLGYEKEIQELLDTTGKVIGEEIKVSLNDAVEFYYSDIVYYLSMACHELKNKPWKQSHTKTDEVKFLTYFKQAWVSYLILCYQYGLPLKELTEEYHAKHKVNVERQNSGY